MSPPCKKMKITDRKNRTDNYLSTILQRMNDLRQTKTLCDVILKIDDRTFHAHRTVLIATCDYFETMLTGQFIESEKEIIEMEWLNPEGFRILLDYMYTSVLSINSRNVAEVLQISDFLQLQWPKEQCSKYLEGTLTSDNAIELWELARECVCDELQNKANIIILLNLKKILNTIKFKKLDFKELETIFQHDKMITTQTDIVFKAIVEWVKYDVTNRQPNIDALQIYIKSQTLSPRFLNSNIFQKKFLTKFPTITNSILENFSHSLPRPPKERSKKSANNIFISSLYCQLNCYKYDMENIERISMKRPELKGYYPVYYKSNIYLTGGGLDGVYSEICPKYNIETETWDEIKLKSERDEHGSCVLNDKMYIIGGWSNQGCKDDMKLYDFNTEQLITLGARMPIERSLFGISVQNECIYVCGGRSPNFYDVCSMDRFDPREGIWTVIAKIENLRESCTSAVISDSIYCAPVYGKTVKRFDIRSNSWDKFPDFPSSRGCSLTESNGHLYGVSTYNILGFNQNESCWKRLLKPGKNFSLGLGVIGIPFQTLS